MMYYQEGDHAKHAAQAGNSLADTIWLNIAGMIQELRDGSDQSGCRIKGTEAFHLL